MTAKLEFKLSRIANELDLPVEQVTGAVELLDASNTVPFITRYRRDQTGGLDERQIDRIRARVIAIRSLAQRKETILRAIESHGKMTDTLRRDIEHADHVRRVEDLYLPFKPKKETLATKAIAQGLETLAREIFDADPSAADLDTRAAEFVNEDKGVASVADALLGAGYIVAEHFSEHADLRQQARRAFRARSFLTSAKIKDNHKRNSQFRDYHEFREPLSRVPPHRVMAINRGEKAGVLRVQIESDAEEIRRTASELLAPEGHPHRELLSGCARDCVDRMLLPALEREARSDLREKAETHAVEVFAQNLRKLLLQPTVPNRRVLAIDPGFKNGCKLAAIDEQGQPLQFGIVHIVGKKPRGRVGKESSPDEPQSSETPASEPQVTETLEAAASQSREHESKSVVATESAAVEGAAVEGTAVAATATKPPKTEKSTAGDAQASSKSERIAAAKTTIAKLVRDHRLNTIAIGNGPACRDIENIVAELLLGDLAETDVEYAIVNEAGASAYSTSTIGREELPNCNSFQRCAVSIGRRLQDPLRELVKIDPASIGVGQYQHDAKAKHLRDTLEHVVRGCVSFVGVDVNVASSALLQYVAGLNQLSARRIIEFRQKNGPLKNRDQLREISGLGEEAFTQAAGFLKISGGEDPLDATWVHPESYAAARNLLAKMEIDGAKLHEPESGQAITEKSQQLDRQAVANELGIGPMALDGILDALRRPGRDPRDDMPKPIFRRNVIQIDELETGMELRGTVLNVVDFGAFVDIGLHDSGLVHVSQLANRFVREPHDVVAVGDQVRVWITAIDKERRRVALTMIEPGTKRPPAEPARRSNRADRGNRSNRQPSRSKQRAATGRRQHTKRPPRPKKPLVPITQEMAEGKEPMRTFGDLAQFFEKKETTDGDDKPK